MLKNPWLHGHKGKFIRKALVTLQFTIAVAFIIISVFLIRLHDHLHEGDDRIRRDNIIYFDNIIFGDSSLLSVTDEEMIEVAVYPNPASGTFQIQGKSIIDKVVLYNSFGQQLIVQQPTAANLDIDISVLSVGVYFVSIESEGHQMVKKLIVE